MSENMSEKNNERIQLKFSSLVVLCVSLVLATGTIMLVSSLLMFRGRSPAPPADFGKPMGMNTPVPNTIPPWGEFVTFDIQLEQPEEYVAYESMTNRIARWVFPGKSPNEVQAMMSSCGFTAGQISEAFSSGKISITTAGIVIRPDDELVLGLTKEVRARFYIELAQWPENHYMRFSYCFMKSLDKVFEKSGVSPSIVSLVRALTYERAGNLYFSDVELVLNRIPTEAERLRWFTALTRQDSVLVRLRIRPDTDVEKLFAYWDAPGVRFKDARPLMESLQRLEDGGTISLLYLLPPFARERLYTSPLPSYRGDPAIDCHWSTLNFFNLEPDARFSDLGYASKFVQTNYYSIAKPTAYGDIIFLLDKNGGAIHSAVHIADDIVFTKNGNNFAQPWILMRLSKLVALYTVTESPKIAVYRRKDS